MACLVRITEQLILIAAADISFVILRDNRREVFNRPRILVFKHGDVRCEEDYRPSHVLCPFATLNATIKIDQELANSVVQELPRVSEIGDGGPLCKCPGCDGVPFSPFVSNRCEFDLRAYEDRNYQQGFKICSRDHSKYQGWEIRHGRQVFGFP